MEKCFAVSDLWGKSRDGFNQMAGYTITFKLNIGIIHHITNKHAESGEIQQWERITENNQHGIQ